MKREYDFGKAKRGAVVSVPKGKTRITIRLDDEVLAWFRDQVEHAGGNYQTVINEVLREHIQARPGNHRKLTGTLYRDAGFRLLFTSFRSVASGSDGLY